MFLYLGIYQGKHVHQGTK